MRKYFISILFILCVLGIYSQNYSFKVEDDIAACFYKKNHPGYFIGRVQLIKMPDGFQEIIGYKEVVTKEDTKIVDNIVDLYPDFVPFKVYSWQLKRIKK